MTKVSWQCSPVAHFVVFPLNPCVNNLRTCYTVHQLFTNGLFTSVSRQVFHDIAYKAKHRQDLLAGIEEFLDEVIVLPPGEWDPDIRIEPPKSLPSSDKRSALIHAT